MLRPILKPRVLVTGVILAGFPVASADVGFELVALVEEVADEVL